ncbi:MAG: hypothetical protein H6735_14360 [Alphaproteobacteria bacterium]|nr:hypothetical protein [Alphaproteobacteria bacterium]
MPLWLAACDRPAAPPPEVSVKPAPTPIEAAARGGPQVLIVGHLPEQPERVGAVAVDVSELRPDTVLGQVGAHVLEPLVEHAASGGCVGMSGPAVNAAMWGVLCAQGTLGPVTPTIPGLEPPDLRRWDGLDFSGDGVWDRLERQEEQLEAQAIEAWTAVADARSKQITGAPEQDGTPVTQEEVDALFDAAMAADTALSEHRGRMREYAEVKKQREQQPDPTDDGVGAGGIPKACQDGLLASLPGAPSATDPSPLDDGRGYLACVLHGDLAGKLRACAADMKANPRPDSDGGPCDTLTLDAVGYVHLPAMTHNDLVIDPVPDFALSHLDAAVMAVAAEAAAAHR